MGHPWIVLTISPAISLRQQMQSTLGHARPILTSITHNSPGNPLCKVSQDHLAHTHFGSYCPNRTPVAWNTPEPTQPMSALAPAVLPKSFLHGAPQKNLYLCQLWLQWSHQSTSIYRVPRNTWTAFTSGPAIPPPNVLGYPSYTHLSFWCSTKVACIQRAPGLPGTCLRQLQSFHQSNARSGCLRTHKPAHACYRSSQPIPPGTHSLHKICYYTRAFLQV